MQSAPTITVSALVSKPLQTVWACWTSPEHIVHWNAASDDWHCPQAENDLRAGGRFSYRMEARDGSFGFDFSGTYSAIEKNKLISFVLDDNRTVSIRFSQIPDGTRIEETFEPEQVNPVELQQTGWQMILNRMKTYCESLSSR